VIILTGPGRSGTSVLTRIYVELGFETGGQWVDEINAGLEAEDVVSANEEIISQLGLTPMGVPVGAKQRFRRSVKRLVPNRLQPIVRSRLRGMPWMTSRGPGLMDWRRFDEVVAKLQPQLARLAGKYQVVKDPRFSWTLAVWAASGVPIEHVTMSLRSTEAMSHSRAVADHLRYRDASGAKNGLVYGMGLALAALQDYRLSYSILRYPDYLETPKEVYAALRFPRAVTEAEFMSAFRAIVRRDLVHDRR